MNITSMMRGLKLTEQQVVDLNLEIEQFNQLTHFSWLKRAHENREMKMQLSQQAFCSLQLIFFLSENAILCVKTSF